MSRNALKPCAIDNNGWRKREAMDAKDVIARRVVGLERLLHGNTVRVERASVFTELGKFLANNPDPKRAPLSEFLTTELERMIASVTVNALSSQLIEGQLFASTSALKTVLAYADDGLYRISAGIFRRESELECFSYLQRAAVLESTFHTQAGDIEIALAKQHDAPCLRLRSAFMHYSEVIAHGGFAQPTHADYMYGRRADVAQMLVSVDQENARAWVKQAGADGLECARRVGTSDADHAGHMYLRVAESEYVRAKREGCADNTEVLLAAIEHGLQGIVLLREKYPSVSAEAHFKVGKYAHELYRLTYKDEHAVLAMEYYSRAKRLFEKLGPLPARIAQMNQVTHVLLEQAIGALRAQKKRRDDAVQGKSRDEEKSLRRRSGLKGHKASGYYRPAERQHNRGEEEQKYNRREESDVA